MQDELISRRAVKDKLLKFCNELEGIFANIRMENQDESVCGLCEYDCPTPYECPGFDNEDCFKLADEIRHKWQSTKDLPSVNPQRTGHWIQTQEKDDAEPFILWECSECHKEFRSVVHKVSNYCPSCGCRRVEPQERSDEG